jgi:hypothetical protein
MFLFDYTMLAALCPIIIIIILSSIGQLVTI